ncbi:MAG: 30S ribosome-binding factor RbfA [Gammaproteobacteria bacterium]|nr:30S ribosome-binding factor RbfA [Gammaproteobacteria bacterium]
MSKEFTRAHRVAEVIHHALAEIIQQEIPSTSFGMITVSQVKLSASLDHARIYVTILNDDKENIKKALDLLEENTKHLRYLLSKKIVLRITPQLKFYYDTSLTHAIKLTALIDEALESDKKLHEEEPKSS